MVKCQRITGFNCKSLFEQRNYNSPSPWLTPHIFMFLVAVAVVVVVTVGASVFSQSVSKKFERRKEKKYSKPEVQEAILCKKNPHSVSKVVVNK